MVSAWVLARYQPEEAWRFLQRALDSDVADVQGGTTAEGIHLGAMAGTVDIVLRCLTGMRARGAVLRFDPALPPEVKQLRFSVHYRGHRVDVAFAQDRLTVSSRPGTARPITVLVGRDSVELRPGGRHEFALDAVVTGPGRAGTSTGCAGGPTVGSFDRRQRPRHPVVGL